MDAQIITACPGERLVIPEARYGEALRTAEEAADAVAMKAFQRRLATGAEDLVPAAIADRTLDGETRLRVWREHREISPSALAGRASIAPETLIAIEEGRRESDLVVLRAVADAPGVIIDDLVG